MSAYASPKLITDGVGRKKLKISLPGGRYQLSLNDGGIILLENDLGYSVRETIPDLLVKVLVATGDAWFPNQRDPAGVVSDLPDTNRATDEDISGAAEYLQTRSIPAARSDLVTTVIEETGLSDRLAPTDITIKELPQPPAGIFDETPSSEPDTTASTDSVTAESTGETDRFTSITDVVAQLSSETAQDESDLKGCVDRLADSDRTLEAVYELVISQFDDGTEYGVFDIPGIGITRGCTLLSAGYSSISEIADARPATIAEHAGLSENMATVAVEGSREIEGETERTATKLHEQTGRPTDTFENALSQLAATGVPPSAAADTLRRVFGPSIVDIDYVDGQTAYYLYEAGYTTPWEVAEASITELEAVDYVGTKTARRIRDDAQGLLDERV